MVTVNIANAGINNFNLPSLLMDALVGKTAETFISSDKVRLYSNKSDYIELTGKFDFSDGTTGNPVDNIVRIANYKVFVDKKLPMKSTVLSSPVAS